jgi:hypothetical protein
MPSSNVLPLDIQGAPRSRERFVRHFLFEPTDRPPYWETISFWDDTIRRWQGEGFPQGMSGEAYFHMESLYWIPEVPIIWIPYFPLFERSVIMDSSEYHIVRNEYGVTLKQNKQNESMPQFIEFPVKDRESWERLAWRIDATHPDRYTPLEKKASGFNARTETPPGQMICPLPVCGGYGFLRNLFGEEGLAYVYYDSPGLVHDIMKTWLSFYAELSSRLSVILDFDFVYIWDDMSYKNGPLISPRMVDEFMVPYYRELIQHQKGLGYRLFMWDSDGDPRKVIPSMLSSGINAFLPCEVNSETEPLELQKEYGKRLSLCGGIDKKMLARGRKDIYEEVMRKVPDLLRHGGYVPAIDHGIPSDVPFENYAYFLEMVRKLGNDIKPKLPG